MAAGRNGKPDEEDKVLGVGEVPEAPPGTARDETDVLGREGDEIDEDAGDVSILKQQVGRFQAFFGMTATDPKQVGAFLNRVGRRIESPPSIHERDGREG